MMNCVSSHRIAIPSFSRLREDHIAVWKQQMILGLLAQVQKPRVLGDMCRRDDCGICPLNYKTSPVKESVWQCCGTRSRETYT
jgi:hypothetical protein